jgi:hypothetical protein
MASERLPPAQLDALCLAISERLQTPPATVQPGERYLGSGGVVVAAQPLPARLVFPLSSDTTTHLPVGDTPCSRLCPLPMIGRLPGMGAQSHANANEAG